MRRAVRGALAVGLAALCLPATAAAHVGRTLPVATDFVARVTAVPAGIEARAIDGDQSLWLRVSLPQTVVVLGFAGEPYLRFSPHGVQANERSATWFLNRARSGQIVPHPPPTATPLRRTVARGRAYRWHEQIRGGLWHVDPPTWLWFWPIAVVLACLAALLRLRSARLGGALALALLVLRRARVLTGIVVGAGAIALGVAWVGVLLHGHVIAVVPAEVLRGAVVACLAAGAGLLAAVLTLPSD